MCILRETREKNSAICIAFSPISKPHTHITYMLRQCTSIVQCIYISIYATFPEEVLHYVIFSMLSVNYSLFNCVSKTLLKKIFLGRL